LVAENVGRDRSRCPRGQHFYDRLLADPQAGETDIGLCVLFGYPVRPELSGVGEKTPRKADLDREKTAKPKSNLAIPGLLHHDRQRIAHAAQLRPAQGRAEINRLNNIMTAGQGVHDRSRARFRLDGYRHHDSALRRTEFVQVLEHRQGVRISCLEEIALVSGFIDDGAGAWRSASRWPNPPYGQYVISGTQEAEPSDETGRTLQTAAAAGAPIVKRRNTCPLKMRLTPLCWSVRQGTACGR